MQQLKRLPKLPILMGIDEQFSAERWLEVASLMRPIVQLQEWPDIGLYGLAGIYIPPHQRHLLYQSLRGAGNNVVVASRGTAKSSTICVLQALYNSMVNAGRTGIILSATGFRGGQMIMLDAVRLLDGMWDSQMQEVPFMRASVPLTPYPVNRSQSFWQITFDSGSSLVTLPTKDPTAIRGWRGQDLYLDEANFFEIEVVEKVAKSFLNVAGDMRHGGADAEENRVFYTTTIDYSWRPFLEQARAAREGLARDMRAKELMLQGDWKGFRKLENTGLHEHTYSQFDYTDVLIRRRIETRDGRTMQLTYPDPNIPLVFDPRGIPFSERGEDGRMLKRGGPAAYYRTYSIQKKLLERSLRDGSTDEASWKSEQRNILDSVTGDVYGTELVDRATCKRDYPIIPFEECPEDWQKKYKLEARNYVAPILYRCDDPCILGVDYAPTSDFTAFVVIRLGFMAEGEFNPLTHHGRTKWSNVIWAEQYRKMTCREAELKIRELMARYKLVWFNDPGIIDPMEATRAIGLDVRGPGAEIRNELARINHDGTLGPLKPGEYRIYDPLDKDERIAAFSKDTNALPMLDAITASDQTNDRLVEYTKGQMENSLLYVASFLDESDRTDRSPELEIGYQAIKILERQLRKIRQKPTKMWRNFYMEGDTEKDRNKKDLFSAFLYAGKQMRAHMIRQQQIDNTPPPMGARVTRVNKHRGRNGKAFGTKG